MNQGEGIETAARGWIPLSLPFGLAVTLTRTPDLRSLLQTLRLYGSAVVRELAGGGMG